MASSRKPMKSMATKPIPKSRQNGSNKNHHNKPNPSSAPKQKSKLKLRLRQKNPYGKIIEDVSNWPPRQDIDHALKKGPTAIANWQKSQIEELIIPHLNGQQIQSIIDKLGFAPSVLFEKICNKLLYEFKNNTLNSLDLSNNQSDLKREKLLNILKHSLRFIRVEQFKQLNIEILSRVDIIPKPILRILSDSKNHDLLKEFPINIKRQVWSHKISLFDREFDSIFNQYLVSQCNDDKSLYFDFIFKFKTDDLYIELSKIKRANNDILKEIVNDIGSSTILFNRSIELLQRHYFNVLSSKHNPWRKLISITNFRIDISCSLFDHAHQHLINENDIIWRLIKIIFYGESSSANHMFTGQRGNNRKDANTLNMNDIDLLYKSLFDKPTMIQTSILLNIPYIKSVLFNTYIHFLEDIANKKILPRDSKTLSLLTSILQISSQPFKWYKSGKKLNRNMNNGAMTSIQQKQNAMELKIPKPDHKVLFEFTPLLTSCIYIDSLGICLDDLDEEDKDIGRLNSDIISWCKDNNMCSYILLYYLLFLINKKNIPRIMEVVNLCIKYRLDMANYLALNALTEINLICKAVLKLNTESINSEILRKLTIKQKCKIVQFLITFIGNTEFEKDLVEPIIDLVQNIGLHQGDKDRFMQQLQT